MTAVIRFTLPGPVGARDLPDCLQPMVEENGDRATVLRTETPLVHLHALSEWALGRGLDLPDLEVGQPTLEDVYLALTNPTAMEPR